MGDINENMKVANRIEKNKFVDEASIIGKVLKRKDIQGIKNKFSMRGNIVYNDDMSKEEEDEYTEKELMKTLAAVRHQNDHVLKPKH